MQVEQLISNVNVRKCCGHDSTPPRLVNESASAIAGTLSSIMNESVRQCRYPIIGNYNFLMYVWVPEVGNTADTPNPPLVLPL